METDLVETLDGNQLLPYPNPKLNLIHFSSIRRLARGYVKSGLSVFNLISTSLHFIFYIRAL